MSSKFVALALLLLAIAWASALVSASAQTRYISEDLEADVRTGKTLQNRIVRMARSGEPVTLLQQDADGYALVRFANGTEGWILNRFLQDQPHARDLLERVQAELDEIRSGDQAGRITQLLAQRRELEVERDRLQSSVDNLENELQELRDVAARPQEIRAQNAQLRDSLLEARNAADEYRRQVEVMQSDSQRKWFVSGAMVTIGSLFLGILLTKLPRRRRNSEW